MHPLVPSLIALVLATALPAQPQTLSADERELAAYRLTMPAVRKVAAVSRALGSLEQKDPKVQEMAKLQAEIEALEAKEELSAADEARLEKLRERAEALAAAMDADDSASNQSISEMEARVRKHPGAAAIFAREGLTSREYVVCLLALLQASLVEGFSEGKADLNNLPAGVNPENVRFVREHKAELETLRDALNPKKEK